MQKESLLGAPSHDDFRRRLLPAQGGFECAQRLRPDDPVGGDVHRALKLLDGALRRRAVDPIDLPGREAEARQGTLEGGDLIPVSPVFSVEVGAGGPCEAGAVVAVVAGLVACGDDVSVTALGLLLPLKTPPAASPAISSTTSDSATTTTRRSIPLAQEVVRARGESDSFSQATGCHALSDDGSSDPAGPDSGESPNQSSFRARSHQDGKRSARSIQTSSAPG